MSKLCLVVRTYNKACNLPEFTAQIEKALHDLCFQLTVVDDGSPDDTARVTEKLCELYRNIVVRSRVEKSGLGQPFS